jgi:Icc-related predicted phosphoesterase
MATKLVLISDTHGLHRNMAPLPDGDILIHAGDISNVGERDQVEDFIDWFSGQPHKHKIFIAGNHDRSFDPKFNREINPYWDIETAARLNSTKPFWLQDLLKTLEGTNTHYLENNGVQIGDLNFWGSPITPWFYGEHWAFNQYRGEEINQTWQLIPSNTDVLITHGPPAFKLDWCAQGSVGCEDLQLQIDLIKPKCHVFGHIHESYGIIEALDTIYVNASICNENYRPSNKPIELEL